MGIFNFIFGKSIKLDDKFFGTMLFHENKKDTLKSYFECKRHFLPSNKIIEIGIDADATGPTQKQIDFFRSIENNYLTIVKSIAPLIEEEFSNWNEGFLINDFQKEFEPVYLRLPRCDSNPIVWEIALESDHDRNHTFTITMFDLEAKEILIDG